MPVLCCYFRVSSGAGMYDFTWRSYFWVFGIFLVFSVDHTPLEPAFLVGDVLSAFALSAFLYIAIAPILAFTVSKYRETGSALQTGKRLLGLGVAMVLMAGVLVLVGVGSEVIKAWLAGKPWGWIVSGLFGLLVMFGYALNFYDAYRARKQINSLNTYTPSDKRQIVRR